MEFHLPYNHSLGPGSQLTSSFFKTGALPKRSVDRFSHQKIGESDLMWWPSKQEYTIYRLCFHHISLYPLYIGWFITSYNHQFIMFYWIVFCVRSQWVLFLRIGVNPNSSHLRYRTSKPSNEVNWLLDTTSDFRPWCSESCWLQLIIKWKKIERDLNL